MVSNFQLFSFNFCSIIHVLLKDFPLCSMNMDKLYIHSRNNSPGGTIQIKNKKKHRKINKKKQQEEKSPRARLVPLGNHCRGIFELGRGDPHPHIWGFRSHQIPEDLWNQTRSLLGIFRWFSGEVAAKRVLNIFSYWFQFPWTIRIISLCYQKRKEESSLSHHPS